MAVRLYLAFVAVLAGSLMGCATKHRAVIKPGLTIQFQGVKNGLCTMADVQLDAKTGNEVVVCRP